LGVLGQVRAGVGLAGGALLDADLLAGQVRLGLDRRRGGHQQRLQRVVVRIGQPDVLLALLGDGDRAGTEVALAGGQRGAGLQAVEAHVLDLGLQAQPGGDLADHVHVESGVFAALFELERRVGDVRAHGQGAGRDQAQLIAGGRAAAAGGGSAATGGQGQGAGGQNGQEPGGRGNADSHG
jgi:hypothetical protein